MKINMTKDEFINYYNTHTYVEMQKELGICPRTLAKIAKELGISKPKGRKKEGTIFNEG